MSDQGHMTLAELRVLAVRAGCDAVYSASCDRACEYPTCTCQDGGDTEVIAAIAAALAAVDAIIVLALARAQPPQTTYGPTSTGSVGDPLSDAQIAALARLQGDGKPSALSGGGQELQASRGAISWRSGATSS